MKCADCGDEVADRSPCPNCGSTRRVIEGSAHLTAAGATGGERVLRLEFSREVLAQTLGTALGGGLLAGIGLLIGVLNEVSWGVVAAAAGALSALTLGSGVLNYFLSRKIVDLKGEACPNCREPIPAPIAWHGDPERETMHSNRNCPNCGRPLIYFVEGELAGEWRLDDTEERRRKMRDEDGE